MKEALNRQQRDALIAVVDRLAPSGSPPLGARNLAATSLVLRELATDAADHDALRIVAEHLAERLWAGVDEVTIKVLKRELKYVGLDHL
ncbi:hypothetical protein [Saccharopolyspora griseoalba]|uniref:Uncharacterized protein n=1 Tax=Saccharopolyspora griseoalba TaxID=1431848 RepID=A0ABW2LSB0_9PSEU